jgi:hypothetical protein
LVFRIFGATEFLNEQSAPTHHSTNPDEDQTYYFFIEGNKEFLWCFMGRQYGGGAAYRAVSL